jgi:hypothetical protein
MRYLAIPLFALLLVSAGAASAQQNPGSFARFTHFNGGMVRLEASFPASDTCQAALSGGRGAPPGQSVANFVIPVTIVIGPNPKGCGNSRLVQRIVSVGATPVTQLIQIFFINPGGRILKIEKVAINTF